MEIRDTLIAIYLKYKGDTEKIHSAIARSESVADYTDEQDYIKFHTVTTLIDEDCIMPNFIRAGVLEPIKFVPYVAEVIYPASEYEIDEADGTITRTAEPVDSSIEWIRKNIIKATDKSVVLAVADEAYTDLFAKAGFITVNFVNDRHSGEGILIKGYDSRKDRIHQVIYRFGDDARIPDFLCAGVNAAISCGKAKSFNQFDEMVTRLSRRACGVYGIAGPTGCYTNQLLKNGTAQFIDSTADVVNELIK